MRSLVLVSLYRMAFGRTIQRNLRLRFMVLPKAIRNHRFVRKTPQPTTLFKGINNMIDIRNYNEIISKIEKLYTSQRIFMPPSKNLIFLCGATRKNSVRYKLKQYFEKHYAKEFEFILAEDLNKLVPEKSDLLSQENILAYYSDCLMIILESPSTFAELGAFANHRFEKSADTAIVRNNEELIKKMLVLNKLEFENEPSFINKGPIRKVKTQSKFKEIYYYKAPSTVLEVADSIINGMRKSLPKYGSHLTISHLKDLVDEKSFSKRDSLQFYLEIVRLLCPIPKNEFIKVFLKLTNDEDTSIDEILGILTTLKYIEGIGNQDNPLLVISPSNQQPFMLTKYEKVRTEILYKYKKLDPSRLDVYYDYCRK